jgi:putative adhesin
MAPAPRRPDALRMRTASRLAVAGALGIVCVVLLAGGALALASTVFRHTDHRSRIARGTVTRVVVAADNGDVALRSGPAGRATVAESRHFWWHKPKLRVALRDGVLTVRVDCGGFGPGCADDLRVTVPRGLAHASVAVDSGDVEMTGVDARRVDALTGSGDLDADGLAGTVRLQTDSGDVTARALRGDTVAAGTDSGDVDVAVLTAPRSLSASTDSGDVDLDVPAERYRVDADAGSGDVTVDGVLRDDTAARRIDAHSDSGDVAVIGR